MTFVLVVTFFLVHHGADFVASLTDRFSIYAIEYMLHGIGGAVLATGLMVFYAAAKQGFWRHMGIVILAFWIVEESGITLCRFFIGNITAKPADATLCTYVTGIPFGKALPWALALYFLVSAAAFLMRRRDEN